MKTHYEHHPACEMLPEMSSDDYERLKSSIKTDGLKDPIVLIGELLLDGRHRLKACEELGVTPKTVQLNDIAPGSNPYTFIFQQHLARRHLSQDQVVALSCKLQLMHEREITTNSPEKEFLTKTSEITSKRRPGRPPGMQRDAENLAEITKGSSYLCKLGLKIKQQQPTLLDDVISGRLTLNQAYKQLKPSPPKPATKEKTLVVKFGHDDFKPVNYLQNLPQTENLETARTTLAAVDSSCLFLLSMLTESERQVVATKLEEIIARFRSI